MLLVALGRLAAAVVAVVLVVAVEVGVVDVALGVSACEVACGRDEMLTPTLGRRAVIGTIGVVVGSVGVMVLMSLMVIVTIGVAIVWWCC